MSSSNSPCAACKCRRQKCTQECVYAPFFPPDQPQKFVNVHKVFGASNIAKLLNELPVSQREDAVNSLAYEAAYRLHDPVYGCVGLISFLQQRLKQLQFDLHNAKKELATYIGPSAMLPIIEQHQGLSLTTHHQLHPNNPSSSSFSSAFLPFNLQQMTGLSAGQAPTMPHGAQLIACDPQQQLQVLQQELFKANYEHLMPPNQQHHIIMRSDGSSFDMACATSGSAPYNQMVSASMSPSLVMGSYESISYEHLNPQQQHDTLHSQELQLESEMATLYQAPAAVLAVQQEQPQRASSGEEGSVGPSC